MTRFTSRKAAVARIWAAVQRLAADTAQPARDDAPVAKKARKSPTKRARAPKGTSESRSNKKAELASFVLPYKKGPM